MISFASTGGTAPGWIRERARCQERIWSPMVLSAALMIVILAVACLLAGLCWAEAAVYYARP